MRLALVAFVALAHAGHPAVAQAERWLDRPYQWGVGVLHAAPGDRVRADRRWDLPWDAHHLPARGAGLWDDVPHRRGVG